MYKLGVLTGGGDCPGLNAVIRAVTKTAQQRGWAVFGFFDGYSGLVENRYVRLDQNRASGLLHRGGTILGTNNRDNPFRYPVRKGNLTEYQDLSTQAVQNVLSLDLEGVIVIGGDGTLAAADELSRKGLKIIGVPKTIDNDLKGTDQTFGFATAVTTATEALDKLHTTAESHKRVMILEVMGRYAGWIALHSGLAGGADIILIPEINWDFPAIVSKLKAREREGKLFSIVVVAEGAKRPDGEIVVKEMIKESADPVRLGGIGQFVAEGISKYTGLETRVTVLGHLQRGGSPVAYDRILATRFGAAAVEAALNGEYNKVVCLVNNEIVPRPITEVTGGIRNVPANSPLLKMAGSLGISLGI